MNMLKQQINKDARRHSGKLIKKISEIIELPDLVKDRIYQEVAYAALDAYRETMKTINRNGEQHEQENDNAGNC